MVRGVWGKATVLATLAVAAVVTALVASSAMLGAAAATTTTIKPIKVKLITSTPIPKSVSNETLAKALKIAKKNPRVKELLEEGYRVEQVAPVVKGKIILKDGKAILSNPEVVGVVLTLKKGGKEVFVTVNLVSGEVLVGEESVIIHYHSSVGS